MHYFILGLPAEPFRARASLFTTRGVLLGDNISAPKLSSSSSIQVPGVGVYIVLGMSKPVCSVAGPGEQWGLVFSGARSPKVATLQHVS